MYEAVAKFPASEIITEDIYCKEIMFIITFTVLYR